jgi:hypothetical protein
LVERISKGEEIKGIEIDPRTLKDELIATNIEKSAVKDEVSKFRERQRT